MRSVGKAAPMGPRAYRAAAAVVLMAATAFAFVRADAARSRAAEVAAGHARYLAQTKLAPLFSEEDLTEPITGARYDSIAASVERTILDETAIARVTVWSDIGRVIYADDEDLVGTRPTFIRDFVYDVANGTTQAKIESGTLKTFTPIWRQAGGTVVVAELDQPFGPIAGTAGRMLTLAALVLGLGSLVCWVLFAMTWRPGAVSSPARPPTNPSVGRPGAAAGGAKALGPVMAAAPPSVVQRANAAKRSGAEPAKATAGMHEVERARTEAEARARAAEERLSRLQLQHKQALDRLHAVEERLTVAAAAPKQSQEELRALRDQVRESAERLHAAEAENEVLRARLGASHLPGAVGAGENAR